MESRVRKEMCRNSGDVVIYESKVRKLEGSKGRKTWVEFWNLMFMKIRHKSWKDEPYESRRTINYIHRNDLEIWFRMSGLQNDLIGHCLFYGL